MVNDSNIVEDISDANNAPLNDGVVVNSMKNDVGVDMVPAEGSVWKLYFLPGRTPTEDEMRVKLGALGAVNTFMSGRPSFTQIDASVDDSVLTIVGENGDHVIDSAARSRAVNNAHSAEKFNEIIDVEVNRITQSVIDPLKVEIESLKNEIEKIAVTNVDTLDEAEVQAETNIPQGQDSLIVVPDPN